MPEMAEELREQVTELLGEPNETIVDALLVYATNEVARVAGGEMVARWQAEDAIKRVETLADHYAAQAREVEDGNGGPIPWTDTMANVVSHLRRAIAGPTPPKGWIHDPNGTESNAVPLPVVSTGVEASGGAGEAQEG